MKLIKALFKITVILLVLNALYHFVPPYYRFNRFRSAAQDLALASRGKSEAVIIADVMELAAEHKVPLERDWVEVRRSRDLTHTYIDATWVETIRFLPSWKYDWVFKVNADGWHVKPISAKDLQNQ